MCWNSFKLKDLFVKLKQQRRRAEVQGDKCLVACTRVVEKLDRDGITRYAAMQCLVLDVSINDSGELGSHSLGLDEVGGGDPDEVDGCLEGADGSVLARL